MNYNLYIALLCLILPFIVHARYNDVVINNRKLFHSGQEFYVKGMAYSPTPLGYNTMNPDGTGGTGLCSPRLTFDGQMKSACHERDFVDGIINPATGKPWFIDMWRRDFAILKELGVNTVRPFFASPFTQKFLRDNPTLYPKANPNQGSILRTFLDVCQEFGLKAIIPVTPDMTMLMNTPDTILDKMAKAIVEEIGDHDALLMYAVGNEMPVHVITSLRDIVNRQMDRVRTYSLQIWGISFSCQCGFSCLV